MGATLGSITGGFHTLDVDLRNQEIDFLSKAQIAIIAYDLERRVANNRRGERSLQLWRTTTFATR